MSHSQHLLAKHFLGSLRVSWELLKFFLSCVTLRNTELSFDLWVHCILEFCLYLLGVSEHVSELSGERSVHSFFDPRLRFVLILRLRLLDVLAQGIEQALRFFLIHLISADYFIDLFCNHYTGGFIRYFTGKTYFINLQFCFRWFAGPQSPSSPHCSFPFGLSFCTFFTSVKNSSISSLSLFLSSSISCSLIWTLMPSFCANYTPGVINNQMNRYLSEFVQPVQHY